MNTALGCPHCDAGKIRLLATSPVPGAWTVHQCAHCRYTWRSTEPLSRTSREHYPERFRLTAQDMASASELPAVPALRG
jgi:hypothetical protein